MRRQFFRGVITGPRPGVKAPRRDRRTRDVRRAIARMRQLAEDLGGADNLSLIQTDRLERYAFVSHWTQRTEEISRATGEPPPDNYFSLLTAELRLGELIGAQRVPRRVPTLTEYLAAKDAAPGTAPPAPSNAAPEGEQ
jgi:hypothetical protein